MTWPKVKGSTTDRGYGNDHIKARRAAVKRHQPTDPCARCHQPLGPMGPWLHYDHTDARDGYLGFSHAVCNRRAGARKGAQVANARAVRRGYGGCPICGEVLAPGRAYCSRRCGFIAHKNDPRPTPKRTPKPTVQPMPRLCILCGGVCDKGRRRYCSDECAVEGNARLNRERYREQNGLPPAWETPRRPHEADRW